MSLQGFRKTLCCITLSSIQLVKFGSPLNYSFLAMFRQVLYAPIPKSILRTRWKQPQSTALSISLLKDKSAGPKESCEVIKWH